MFRSVGLLGKGFEGQGAAVVKTLLGHSPTAWGMCLRDFANEDRKSPLGIEEDDGDG